MWAKMQTATIIGIVMVVAGVILGGVLVWRAVVYRNRTRAARKPLD